MLRLTIKKLTISRFHGYCQIFKRTAFEFKVSLKPTFTSENLKSCGPWLAVQSPHDVLFYQIFKEREAL